MPKKNDLTPIYSKTYYRFQKLIKDRKFQEQIRWLYSRYEKFGCPVPKGGFKTYTEYEKWLSLFWKIYYSIEKTNRPQKVITTSNISITNGLRKIRIRNIIDIYDPLFPPAPHEFIICILEQFEFDKDKNEYRGFISDYLFRGKKEYTENTFQIRWIRDEKTDKFELFIQILPNTKKEHIDLYWHHVIEEQKLLPGYIGKNKKWENFERDMYVYNVYKDLQNKLTSKRTSRKTGQRPLDEQTWLVIKKKYPRINLDQIKDIISRIDKLKA